MPRTINILCGRSHIELMRSSWTETVDFNITLENISKKEAMRKYTLYKNESVLRIDNLNPNDEYLLKIQLGKFLRRIWTRANVRRITPKFKSKILIIGSGRCGTTSIAKYLNGLCFVNGTTVLSSHETLSEYILPLIIDRKEDEIRDTFNKLICDVESAPYYSMLDLKGFLIDKIIHIIRDGRRVVQSGYNRGWYGDDTLWNRIKPKFEGDRFEKCCRFWAYMVGCAESKADRFYRLEDLAVSERTRFDLLNYLNIKKSRKKFPVSNKNVVATNINDWTLHQKHTFEEHCSKYMDRYYPSWRKDF